MEQPNSASLKRRRGENDESSKDELPRTRWRRRSSSSRRRAYRIALYGKIVRKSARFKAHDERNEANVGDVVRIAECRPISREKRWRLVEIVERAK